MCGDGEILHFDICKWGVLQVYISNGNKKCPLIAQYFARASRTRARVCADIWRISRRIVRDTVQGTPLAHGIISICQYKKYKTGYCGGMGDMLQWRHEKKMQIVPEVANGAALFLGLHRWMYYRRGRGCAPVLD